MTLGKARSAVIVIPWLVMLGLLAWHAWDWARSERMRRDVVASLPPDARGLVRDVTVYRAAGLWKIYSFEDVVEAQEVCLVESGPAIVEIRRDPARTGYARVTVFSRKTRIVDVGCQGGQTFPGFVVYSPQSGPDRGKMLGDYNLDGLFEVRWPKESEADPNHAAKQLGPAPAATGAGDGRTP